MIDYDQMLSSRAMELKPSGIRKFFDILEEMQDVVSLTVGQPDFDVVSVSDEDGVVFSAKVAVRPEVKIENYFGIEAEKTVAPVTG